jgi:hypothetical protein
MKFLHFPGSNPDRNCSMDVIKATKSEGCS